MPIATDSFHQNEKKWRVMLEHKCILITKKSGYLGLMYRGAGRELKNVRRSPRFSSIYFFIIVTTFIQWIAYEVKLRLVSPIIWQVDMCMLFSAPFYICVPAPLPVASSLRYHMYFAFRHLPIYKLSTAHN